MKDMIDRHIMVMAEAKRLLERGSQAKRQHQRYFLNFLTLRQETSRLTQQAYHLSCSLDAFSTGRSRQLPVVLRLVKADADCLPA
jgi:sugar diacid utilization regulator